MCEDRWHSHHAKQRDAARAKRDAEISGPGSFDSSNGTTGGGLIPTYVAGRPTKPITNSIPLADIRDWSLACVGHAGHHVQPREYRSEANPAFGSTCMWLTMPSKSICPSLSYGVPRRTYLLGHSRSTCAPTVSTTVTCSHLPKSGSYPSTQTRGR